MIFPTLLKRLGPLLVLAVLVGLLSLLVPDFLGLRNLRGLLLSVTLVGTIAATMMLVLAMREVDLSVGSIVALSGVLAAVCMSTTGSIALGVLAGLAGGAAVGFINGVLVAGFRVNSLIVTLAMMEVVRGLAFLASGGESVAIPLQGFYELGSGGVLGLSWPIWSMIGSFAIFGLILKATVFGRNILAIGGNPEAARLAGVPITRVRIIVFTLQGLVAALAGIILAARITSGQPNTSIGLELAVISACVLGGVSLSGGLATIGGVIVGVFIMGAAQNALNLLNVPTFYQYVVRGGILLLAVVADRLRQDGRLPRMRLRPTAIDRSQTQNV
ncbi:L-arabinose ABC transporter permease AraH [Sphingomonas sp. MMS24-J45]|uniref:L-arabinose ABC transporter permease AraH n=1 Tax=Sphingomonas sp. MMS24-J45 TaxID=3238806 RepID=UPI00384E3F9D